MSLARHVTPLWLLAVALAIVNSCAADNEPDDAAASDRGPAAADQIEVPDRGLDSTDDLNLEDLLHLPDGIGSHPAVMLVHSSGPFSRDGVHPGQLGLT